MVEKCSLCKRIEKITAMSMVFRFRMLTEENDNFLRAYEVMYDST